MLTISEVSKGYGGRTLFAGATLQVNAGDRIGIVGANGAGKSTLFSLMLQEEEPDDGVVILDRRASLGYLPQEVQPVGDETVLAIATSTALATVRQQQMVKAGATGATLDQLSHGDDGLTAFELEPRAKQILRGLGFREKDFDRPARELSGGWVMRARLAQLLTQSPDLLLLDEPTNHLDLEAQIWFQNFLRNYKGAILVVSHDREFLNQLVDSIVEIRLNQLMRYKGNYESYLELRQSRLEQMEAAYKNQQREIARLMTFVNRFRAKNTKATQAQSKLKQIERMELIAAPTEAERDFEFEFPQPERSGQKVITLTNVAHAYGPNIVYQNVDFQAERGERIVLVGPNGAGKSTLLKILAEVLPLQTGTRELGYRVKAGYFSQYRVEMLKPERTVLEEGLDTPQRVTEVFVRTVLGSFGFCGDDVFKPVSVLSGGEKSRLALVKLLLDPPNLLLMDEPTTHLDMDGVEALVLALEKFEGTIIFISHDVYFIRAIANHVVRVSDGRLRHFTGGYQYYLDRMAEEARLAEALAASNGAANVEVTEENQASRTREQRRLIAQQQDARARARREQQKLVNKLEKEIHQCEQRQLELTAEMENPATYEQEGRAAAVNRELADVVARLPQLMDEWTAAAARLQELEGQEVRN